MRRSLVLFCVLSTLLLFVIAALPGSVPSVPTGTWKIGANMTQSRDGSSAALLVDGRVLITGGNVAGVPLATAEILGADGTFTSAAPMAISRSNHITVSLADGRVLVAGGTTTGGGVTNAAEIYDPIYNSWTSVAGGMVEARSGHSGTLLYDGRVLIIGGSNSWSISSTIEVFDPHTNSFSFAGAMSSPRKDQAAALLPDGRVLIAGGYDGSNALASVDIYDPQRNSVSHGPSLTSPRAGLSATSLLDGKILVAGGNNGSIDLASGEIFDPAAGSWTGTSSNLATARRNHLAVRLSSNNAVLIAGGTSQGNALSSAELYLPWAGGFVTTGSMSAPRNGSVISGTQFAGISVVAGGSGQSSSEYYGFATLHTDKSDYAPGTTVTITGSGWQPGEKVSLLLHEDLAQPFHLDRTLTATADAYGNIFNNQFVPEHHDIGVRFYLTATGKISQAQMTFTDGSPSASLDQCGNGGVGTPIVACVGSSWQNGNVNGNQAQYLEGQSVPYRMRFGSLATGPATSHTVTIQWDTTKGGKHALDYVTTWNRNALAGSDPCSGVTGCSSTISSSTFHITTIPIPTDPNVAAGPDGKSGTSDDITQAPGAFTLFGGTITGVSGYTLTGAYSGDSSTSITITFTADVANPVLAWSGHISTRLNWGQTSSAISISGSPYHTLLGSLDGSGGNQDRALATSAVIFPAQIIIVKSASPKSSTSFPFTSSDFGNFSLVDDGSNTGNSQTFGDGITSITNFKTYTFDETASAAWKLNTINCSIAPGGTGKTTFTTNIAPASGSHNLSVSLAEGDIVACTFSNSQQTGHILVQKITNPTGDSQNFTFTPSYNTGTPFNLTGGQTSDSGALSVGSYSVIESATSGWDLTKLFCVTTGTNGSTGTEDATNLSKADITLNAGDSVSCTYTNTKRGSIVISKNSAGGTGTFNFTSTGGLPNTGSGGSFSVSTATFDPNSQTFSNIVPGAYTVTEAAVSGWSLGLSCTISGTNGSTGIQNSATPAEADINLKAGDTVTCNYTNTKAATLTVVKNTTGGDATFNFSGAGSGVSPSFSLGTSGGTAKTSFTNLTPGSGYSVSETVPTGWIQTSATCDSGKTISAIVLNAGDNVTCTFANTKQATLTVIKNTTGGTGTFNFSGTGTGVTSSFSLTTDSTGTAETSFTNLTPGSGYSVSETVPTGWIQTSATCDSGKTISAIVLNAGDNVTCTFANTKQATLTVIKNTTGGTGTFNFSGTGTGVTSSFSLTTDSTGTAKTSFTNLAPGSGYSVSETVPTGWIQTSATCDSGKTISAIVLNAGDNVTCTFANTKQATLTVIKNTTGGTGTFNFSGTGTGVTSSFSLTTDSTGTAETSFTNLTPGSGYSVSETVPTGWIQTSATCDSGKTISAIVLNAGDNVTCTFANTKQATLTVIKNTTGGTGTFNFSGTGTGVTSSFSLTTDSTGTAKTSFTNLAPGSGYSVSETVPTGWIQTSATCDSGKTISAIVLNAGDNVTCTFANTKQAALTVIKNTTGGTGTFNFSGTGTGVTSSFSLTTDSTGTAKTTFTNLAPGSGYSVSETVPTGWIQTSATCDSGKTINAIVLNAGDNVTCTFANTKQSTLVVVKNATAPGGTFNFTGTGSGVSASFSLTTSNGTAQTSFANLTPGSGYAISETGQSGWTLAGASCNNGNAVNAITLNAGQTVTCTFNNTFLPPNLTITKTPDIFGDSGYEIHPSGTATFTITVSNIGAGPATGTVLTDTLNSGVGTWTSDQLSACAISNVVNLICNIGTLNPGSSFTAHLQATIPTNYLLPPTLPLGTSTFEIDGNLTVTTAGGEDWTNIGINCASTPTIGCAMDLLGKNATSFGQGTSEDSPVPSVVTGSIPNKDALTRLYIANQKVSGTDFLYLAWERVQAPTGTTDMDFELNQSRTLSSNGVTPVRTAGDLLITYDLASGGTVPALGYHNWITAASAAIIYPGRSASQVCQASSSFPCWGQVQILSSNVQGAVNTVSVPDPILGPGQTSPATLAPFTFGEALINLEGTGIFPATITDASQCLSFGQAYLKSRSSTSFSAELKAFVAPISITVSSCPAKFLNNLATVQAPNNNSGVGVSDTGQIEVDVPPPSN